MMPETKIGQAIDMVEGFRLAPQQEHLWSLMQGGPVHPYLSRCRAEIVGKLDAAALAGALDDLVARHEVVRTRFRLLSGMLRPLQVVAAEGGAALVVYDLEGLGARERETRLASVQAHLSSADLDLQEGPLIRAVLVRLEPERHLLELVTPSLCADCAGLASLVREIGRCYAARTGRGMAVLEAPLQYADAAEIFHQLLESDDTAKGREYWHKQDLSGLADLSLPEEGMGTAPFSPAVLVRPVPARDLGRIEEPALREALPPAAFYLASWQLVLARLAQVRRLVVGLACDGRSYEDLQDSPGLFARHLPVTSDLAGEESFLDLWRRGAESMREATRRQDFFSWELHGDGVPPSARFFPFCFEFAQAVEPIEAGGTIFTITERWSCYDRFRLKLCCIREGDALALELHYDACRYRKQQAELLIDRLAAVIADAAAAPQTALDDLELLGEAERQRLLVAFNVTRFDFPDLRLHDLFEEQAARLPDRVALEWEDGAITYGELAARARRLAWKLRRLGVGPEVRVAVYCERSVETVVGLLGVLASGGVYVPIEPSYPRERLAAVLEDACPGLLLAQRHRLADLPSGAVLSLPLEDDPAEESSGPLPGGATLDGLAYVIYTSGSTGRPKGVMVSHRAIANRLLWMRRVLPLDESDVQALKTRFSFDASIWELFLPLACGTRLVLARPEGHRDPAYLADLVVRAGATVLQLVPSMLAALLEEPGLESCTCLRRVFCGGEALPAELRGRLASRLGWGELHNLYGPTECAIDATHWPCPPDAGEITAAAGALVPIGRPIDNDRVYVLGPRLRPVPEGLPGELCVGGTGLARGYLGLPDRTAEKFVPDPFSGEPGARLYRTGDLARHLPGGALTFLGRLDHQVKLRGFRVELGEIEAVLATMPGVLHAVVALWEYEPNKPRLVAYTVPRPGEQLHSADLRAFLAERLPEYMIPSAFLFLEELPRLPNGKVDRSALPAPSSFRSDLPDYEAPYSAVEQVLAGIWAEVLGVDRVGLQDNFFEMGGHSLLATQLVSRLRRVFGIELPLRGIFESPTLASLGARIDAALRGGRASAPPPIVPARREGPLPLSFAQQRLWFLYKLQPDSPFYNIPVAVRFRGALNVPALKRSLGEIVRRHAALRTTFHEGPDGEPLQVLDGPTALLLPIVDLADLSPELRAAEVERQSALEAGRPFDLEAGPLFRAVLLGCGEDEHVGLLTMHHITSDGWSTAVLIRELGVLYRAFSAEEEMPPLPALSLQYADFAVWQRRWLSGEVLEAQLSYWKEALAGAPRRLELPTDHPRPAVQRFRGAVASRPIAAQLSDALKALARRQGVTLFMLLVAAGKVLLRWWSGQNDLVVGTDVANRNRGETEGLIGFFINQLALRTRLAGDLTFEEVLGRVREVTLGAYAHEDLPFDRLVMALNPERSRSHAPLFQVKINLHNIPTPTLDLPGLTIEPLRIQRDTAQFDLIFNFVEGASGLVVAADYATDLFKARTITRMLSQLELLLTKIVERPEASLRELEEILSDADHEMRLAEQQDRLEAFRQTLPTPEPPALQQPVPAATVEGFRFGVQQARIWRLLQGAEKPPFRVRCTVGIEGDVDEASLRAALSEVVARHEILRTDFRLLPGMSEPLQVITREGPRWLGEHDFSALEGVAREAALEAIWNALRADGGATRAALARLADRQRWLLLELSPLCGDGPTLRYAIRDLARAYGAGRGEAPPSEEPLQYADISEWFHNLLATEEAREEASYWQEVDLADVRDLELPFESPAALEQAFNPRVVTLESTAGVGAPASFWLACWAVLLGRLTGRREVPVAVGCEGRLYAELEGALGPLARWLPVSCAVPEERSFARVQERAGESLEAAAARQNSFTWNRADRGDLLFPAACFDFVDLSASWNAGDLRFSLEWQQDCLERFKLKLVVVRRGDRVELELHFDAARFSAEDVRRLARFLETLAASALSRPEAMVDDLEILPDDERQRVLFDLNQTAMDLPAAGLLHGPFERQARQTPERVALRFEEGILTYGELNAQAGQTARRLRALGVGPEVPVAVCIERSPSMVVGLLGILKAGGGYVPLDPEHPVERRRAILAEVAPRVLVTERRLAGDFAGTGTPLLCLDEPWEESGGEQRLAPVRPEHLAYILYTSGSTGRPKGVMVSHRAISNRVLWMQCDYPLGVDDRVLQKTPYGFDASIWEIFLPLSVGAEAVLARPGGHRDLAYLAAAIRRHHITVLQLVPSLLRAFLEEPRAADCKDLRRLFCGGEELFTDLAARFLALLPAELHNLYGPTETAIDATCWPCREGIGRRSVPIGRPIANVRVYVLDGRLHPVPAGVAGELCVGGIGVARGYFGRPDATAERFVPDPYGGELGARLYRTGDRARQLPEGELEYLGRLDRQVKVRGIRIEPLEIEVLLREHPAVRDAVVTVRGDGPQAQLVAYVVGRERREVEPRAVREFLRERLPDAMVPGAVVRLPALPLMPNGKLDWQALPEPEEAPSEVGFVAPRSETEALLAGFWCEVLGIDRVGVHDNFFELGGHSLSATQLISRVRNRLGVDLAIHRLFDAPTVASLARALEAAVRGGELALPALERVPRTREMPLSFSQQRLWFFERMLPGTPVFNIPVTFRLSGSLDVSVLERALTEVVRRHEALRTIFPDREGLPVQVIEEPWTVVLPVVDLRALAGEIRETEARRLVAAEENRPCDLARGPLLRALLLQLGESEHAVAMTVHHVVSDAWSSGVLAREMAALYRAFSAGERSPLPELPVQYADFAVWQQRWLAGEILAAQTAWWKERLEGAPPRLELPSDRPRPAMPTYRGATLRVSVPAELTAAVRAVGRRYGATLFMTLLAAWKLLLHHLTGRHDIVVGTDVANRNRLETEGLIGFFINQLALRTDLSDDPTFAELLSRVREMTLGAYAHQDTPFEHLVDALQLPRDLSYAPLFQVKFFLENTPQETLDLPGVTLSPLEFEVNVAKLDLTFALWERDGGLVGWINYSTDLFDASRIERLVRRYASVLELVVADPEACLSEIKEALVAIEEREMESQAEELRRLKLRMFKAVVPKVVSLPGLEAASRR